jgi:hypothetical protein
MDYVDSESGACLVVGGAACVWNDLRPFHADYGGKFGGKFDVIAVNDIGMHFPGPCKHLYSNNNPFLKFWVAARRDQFVSTYGPIQITHSQQVGGMVTWPWPGAGTSALGAVYTALALGYDRIILCGIPLDDTPHYFEPDWRASSFSKQVPLKGSGKIKYWQDAKDRVFMGKVTSRSGRTRELLGEPG